MQVQITDQENDLEEYALLDIQKKLAEVLKTKGEIQMKCFLIGSREVAC